MSSLKGEAQRLLPVYCQSRTAREHGCRSAPVPAARSAHGKNIACRSRRSPLHPERQHKWFPPRIVTAFPAVYNGLCRKRRSRVILRPCSLLSPAHAEQAVEDEVLRRSASAHDGRLFPVSVRRTGSVAMLVSVPKPAPLSSRANSPTEHLAVLLAAQPGSPRCSRQVSASPSRSRTAAVPAACPRRAPPGHPGSGQA